MTSQNENIEGTLKFEFAGKERPFKLTFRNLSNIEDCEKLKNNGVKNSKIDFLKLKWQLLTVFYLYSSFLYILLLKYFEVFDEI